MKNGNPKSLDHNIISRNAFFLSSFFSILEMVIFTLHQLFSSIRYSNKLLTKTTLAFKIKIIFVTYKSLLHFLGWMPCTYREQVIFSPSGKKVLQNDKVLPVPSSRFQRECWVTIFISRTLNLVNTYHSMRGLNYKIKLPLEISKRYRLS